MPTVSLPHSNLREDPSVEASRAGDAFGGLLDVRFNFDLHPLLGVDYQNEHGANGPQRLAVGCWGEVKMRAAFVVDWELASRKCKCDAGSFASRFPFKRRRTAWRAAGCAVHRAAGGKVCGCGGGTVRVIFTFERGGP